MINKVTAMKLPYINITFYFLYSYKGYMITKIDRITYTQP